MVDLKDAVSLLLAKRKELIDQLDAVEKAISALSGVADTVAMAPEVTRHNPPRTLSDEHKHALREGSRKARHSKDAAAGLAREMTDPSAGLASRSRVRSQPPRLVKRTKP
jgi:hypothetical protein